MAVLARHTALTPSLRGPEALLGSLCFNSLLFRAQAKLLITNLVNSGLWRLFPMQVAEYAKPAACSGAEPCTAAHWDHIMHAIGCSLVRLRVLFSLR